MALPGSTDGKTGNNGHSSGHPGYDTSQTSDPKSDWGEEGEYTGTTEHPLPKFGDDTLMQQSSGRLLAALKSQIEQLSVEQDGSGIRHDDGRYVVLPRTLRTAWLVRVNHSVLGAIQFLVGQTRSTWVLLYDQPHEKLYEDPRFMDIELGRRDVTRTPKGKRMFVSRIEKADVVKINAIATQDTGPAARPDTLAPTEGAFSLEDTLARLRQCVVDFSTDANFDRDAFVSTILFITPTQGEAGDFYYLEVGDADNPAACELYVGADPGLPASTYENKATMSYGNERCFLYIDVR